MWYNKILGCLVFILSCTGAIAQQDKIHLPGDTAKIISYTGPVGSTYTVPPGKTWHVQSLFCNTGSYNIKVSSIKFKDLYLPGEKISLPAWCAEVELFDNKEISKLMYQIKIEERKQ